MGPLRSGTGAENGFASRRPLGHAVCMAMKAPTIEDARRAGEALWREGVGRVLVFGSVARGDVRPFSDIDLVAVLASVPDLGCDICHGRLQGRLSVAAEGAVGRRVDVVATDAPTWAARSQLPFALESVLAAEAVELFDRLDTSRIDWDQPIEAPLTALAEAERRLGDGRLTLARWSSLERFHLRDDTPGDGRGSSRTASWAHSVVHSAARAMHVHELHAVPPHTPDTSRIVDALPDPERGEWQRLGATTLIDPDAAEAASAGAAARTALATAGRVAERLEAAGAEPDALGECRDAAREIAEVLELA